MFEVLVSIATLATLVAAVAYMHAQLSETIYKDTSEEFTVRVAKTSEEITKLLEVVSQYMCKKDGLVYFRKRK
jgi:hypothetical protein